MENTIYSQYWQFTIWKYMVLKLFNSYSATYGPISMKLCMLVNDVMTHMLINFWDVLSFPLGFIGCILSRLLL